MQTGAIIITTILNSNFSPLQEIGSISAIRRIILNFKHAKADNIIVVLNEHDKQMEKHIAYMGVTCIHNSSPHEDEFESIKIGLSYLNGKCDNIFITPVNIPLFKADTIVELLATSSKLAIPSYSGKIGYPVLINSELIPSAIKFKNKDDSFYNALLNCGYKHEIIEVDDPGIIIDVSLEDKYDIILEDHNLHTLHPDVRIRLAKEEPFFGPGTVHLLSLIKNTQSVRLSCQQMGISYSKAWKMIASLEKYMNCSIVKRQQGGKFGGEANLTDTGDRLLEKYIDFEKECKEVINKIFDNYFGDQTF